MKERYKPILIVLLTLVLGFSSFAFVTLREPKRNQTGCPTNQLIWIDGQKVCLRSNPDLALQIPVFPNEAILRESLLSDQVETVYFLIDSDYPAEVRARVAVAAIEISKGLGMKQKKVDTAFTYWLPDMTDETKIMDLDQASPNNPIIYLGFGNQTYILVNQSKVLVIAQDYQLLDLACDKVFLTLMTY